MPNMRNSYMGNLGSYQPQRGPEDMAAEVQAGAQNQAALTKQGQDFARRRVVNTIGADMERFPGRAPNGTGPTGVLGPMGWALMQQQQMDYLKAKGELGGKGGPAVRGAPLREQHMPSPYEDPEIATTRSAYNTMNRGGTTPGYTNKNQAFEALQALYSR